MSRNFTDWLSAYCEYTGGLESPTNIHFFSGVMAISSVLRRQVWFNQGYFKWYPNFYIIIVAKPGIVTKSTSIGVAMDIARDVPGVHMGPSAITWQGLVQYMGGVAEQVDINGELHTQSCLTFAASELGTLIDFRDRAMIDVLVDLWDGKTGVWEKMTKQSGVEGIVNPWISIIAGTTPSWLGANMPETAIGGGFASRCIFIHGHQKREYIAYPKHRMPAGHYEFRQKLVADLEHISLMRGEFRLTPECEAYGEAWYKKLWTVTPDHLKGERFEGYVARKQTHLHKLCMVLSASCRDSFVITLEDFQKAEALLESVEDDMLITFDRIGRSENSLTLDQFVLYLREKRQVTQADACRYLARYSSIAEVQRYIDIAVMSNYVKLVQRGSDVVIVYCETLPESPASETASVDSILGRPPSAH